MTIEITSSKIELRLRAGAAASVLCGLSKPFQGFPPVLFHGSTCREHTAQIGSSRRSKELLGGLAKQFNSSVVIAGQAPASCIQVSETVLRVLPAPARKALKPLGRFPIVLSYASSGSIHDCNHQRGFANLTALLVRVHCGSL